MTQELEVVTASTTPDRPPEQPVAAIIWHGRAADLFQERADEHRWEAARLMYQEINIAGTETQRSLAAKIGKSQRYVGWCLSVHKIILEYLGTQNGSWNKLYQQVKRNQNDLPRVEGEESPSSYEQRRSQLSSEWYTPAYVIGAARAVLGEIDLDPASCEKANQTVRAAEIFTEADDGLSLPWHGKVWLNPPYQGKAGAFVTKLVSSYTSGDVKAGIVLVTALTTDTRWFRALWAGVLCFTYGRIPFDGEGGSSNTAGSVFAYFGPNEARFAQEFSELGAVVRQWTP